MWFYRIDEKKKDLVRQLVWNGQLELIQGGWSAPDEACPNYDEFITNMYIGHNFMKKEFGVTSKIGWQIDAFGHSSAHTALLADFGFEALFFTRIEQRTREQLQKEQADTFLWRPFSKHFGNQKQVLTIMTKKDYAFPDGFKYDERYNENSPVITDKSLDHYNAEYKAVQFINQAIDALALQKNKGNLMMFWGDDFAF